jgi:hypothetical protein
MSAPGESTRSIAVELALLFLHELEPLVAEDPERLVSTEAVLSFAAIRRGDPITCNTGAGFWRNTIPAPGHYGAFLVKFAI